MSGPFYEAAFDPGGFYVGSLTPIPTATTVAIYVDGNDVTADVVFASCRFTSYVNGKPGEGAMRVRDSARSYSFTTGADWLVLVNGDAAWRGFVTSIVDTYIAPAIDVADFGPTRFFDLVGADMNLLFSRRIVYDQADPANVTGTQFPPGTDDTVAITELLDDWLLLSGDDLDTTSGVTHVGDLDPEQQTRAWSGGWTFGNAMDTIAMLPAAIYYLRPEAGSPKATLCYVDVDAPTAPFGLSDMPNGSSTSGYREMEITLDGSSMANDVMAWGFGYGSKVPVFSRNTDAASQAAHGLWQNGILAPGVYKQGTINRIAESVIDGSPSSKRGAKIDKTSVSLVTYVPGLLAGHVVPFTSNIWGFADNIPVRQMTLLFEGPDIARYEITLSHEIDAPWSFIDQFWPQIPGFPPCYVWPCGPPPPGNPHQPTSCDCGLTDDFERVELTSLGTASIGIAWSTPSLAGNATLSVDGHRGVFFTPGQGAINSQAASILGGSPIGTRYPFSGQIRTCSFELGNSAMTPSDDFYGVQWSGVSPIAGGVANLVIGTTNAGGPRIRWTFGPTDGTSIPSAFWGDGKTYTWTIEQFDATTMRTSITDGVATYSADIGALPAYGQLGYSVTLSQVGPAIPSDKSFNLLEVDIPEINDCSLLAWDIFDRTVASSFGTSSAGTPYTTEIAPAQVGTNWGVTPGSAYLNPTTAFDFYFVSVDNPAAAASEFEITAFVTLEAVASGTAPQMLMYVLDSFSFGAYVGAAISATNSGSDQVFVRDSVGGDTFATKTDWDTGGARQYVLALGVTPTEIRMKVYQFGDVDPGWLVSMPVAFTPQPMFVLTAGTKSGTTIEWNKVAFSYRGEPCFYESGVPVLGADAAPTTPSGWACEEATRVSSTVYATSAPFIPETAFAWRDGLFQRRGFEFDEGSDNQSLVFGSSVGSSEVISVCYFTTGPVAT